MAFSGDIVTAMGFWEQLKDSGFTGRRLDVRLGAAVGLPEAVLTQPTSPDAPTVVPPDEATDSNIELDDGGDFDIEIAEDELEDEEDSVDLSLNLSPHVEVVEATEPDVEVPDAPSSVTDPQPDRQEETPTDDELVISDEPVEEQAAPAPPAPPSPAVAKVPAAELIAALAEDLDDNDGDTQIFRRPAPEPETAPEDLAEDVGGEDTVTDGHIHLTVDAEIPAPPAPAAPARYANSLNLPDRQVIAILREENYPHLEDVRDDALYQLSRLEEVLMERAVDLGESYRKLVEEIVPVRDLWQAAIWVTGMHRDPMMREGLRRLREEGSSSTARWLGWMVWPYTDELLGAANGLDDPAGMLSACDALGEALSRRAALIRTGPHSMSLEAARYPSEAQGIFRREGFSWLDRG